MKIRTKSHRQKHFADVECGNICLMYHVFRALCKSTFKALGASLENSTVQMYGIMHKRIQKHCFLQKQVLRSNNRYTKHRKKGHKIKLNEEFVDSPMGSHWTIIWYQKMNLILCWKGVLLSCHKSYSFSWHLEVVFRAASLSRKKQFHHSRR